MSNEDDVVTQAAPGPRWRKALLLLHRVVLRTERGPLRPLWAALYAAAMHIVAAYLCYGHGGAAAYVCRSLAIDEPVYGLSDIDLVVVIPGAPGREGQERKRLKRRWERLCRAVPPLAELLPDVAFYEDAELAEAMAGSILTYGLAQDTEASPDQAAFFGVAAPTDEFGLRSRPGVYGPTRDWRSIRGPDRRPSPGVPGRQAQRIAAWQELQFWWSFAFGCAADPERPRSAFLCVKLVAEPARIWLYLAHGDEILSRRHVLERSLTHLPDEDEEIRRTLELYKDLGRFPSPPLAESLPPFVRLTSRVASRLCEEVQDSGETPVRLIGGAEAELLLHPVDGRPGTAQAPEGVSLLPLVDWRALAVPSLPDESLWLMSGNVVDPHDLGTAARVGRRGPYPLLISGRLLVLPTLGAWDRAWLRAVQCQPTDPVSFALVEGSGIARFPNVRGWCAEDWARRSVAEHRAWLTQAGASLHYPEWPPRDAAAPSLRAMAKLFTAARAGLFSDSLELGDPELRLTVRAVAERLAESRGARTVADLAVEAYAAGLATGSPPSADVVAALRKLVMALPAYATAR
jgi:predicted nucleotidyltransferase